MPPGPAVHRHASKRRSPRAPTPLPAPHAAAIEPELEPILTTAMGACTWSGALPPPSPSASAGLDSSAPSLDVLGSPSPDGSPVLIDASHPPAPPPPPGRPAGSPAGGDGIGDLLSAQQQLYGSGCTTCLLSNVLASQHAASMAIISNIG